MKILTDATLYIVNGPRGAYYAIHEHESGAILTERTEHAAAAMANEKDMVIVDRREITHAQLLGLMAPRCTEPLAAPTGDQP